MARYIDKNLCAAGIAEQIEIQLSYAIGIPDPISIAVNTFNTSKYDESTILSIIKKVFDCSPGMIIKNFSLNQPTFRYQDIVNYGHFGRPDVSLPWEKLDKVEEIKSLLKSR